MKNGKRKIIHNSGIITIYGAGGKNGSKTLKSVVKELNSSIEQKIIYSTATKKTVSSYDDNKLIVLHSHPSSMPPSAADFNSCFQNGYKRGYIACHDGKLFAYTSEQKISEELYSLYIAEFVEDSESEYEAQMKTLHKQSVANGDIFSLSFYGETNAKEFFAESFAAYTMGERLPEPVNELIKEVLKRGAM